jgi:hypothetical protein
MRNFLMDRIDGLWDEPIPIDHAISNCTCYFSGLFRKLRREDGN